MTIYSSNTIFAKPGVAGNSRLFLSDATVAPVLTGTPTLVEIAAAAPTARNVIAYYTGTNTSTDISTFVYAFDSIGAVTLLEDPEKAIVLLYKGKLASVASVKALVKSSLVDAELRIVGNIPYMWSATANVGAFQPTDTVNPGIDAGWWIKISDEYAGAYSSTEAYSVGDLVVYNNKLYKANVSREEGVWGAAPTVSDTQFRPLGGIIQQFDSNLSYLVGDLVYNDTSALGPFTGVYKVTTAFTGGSFPSASGFSLVFAKDQFKGSFTSLAYVIGDIVEYSGQLYKATATNGTNGLLAPFPTASWTLISSTIDVIVAYQDFSLFKADTTTVFKVGDKISIDNPFQVLQVLTAGTGFAGITTQFIVNQAQGLEFSKGIQVDSDFTPDQVLFGNNYYVAFLTGTTNINVAALENEGVAGIASVGQVINFTAFNTTAVSTTLVFDASWKDSAGAALGTITLAAGEYKRLTFEGYYAIPTQLRLVEYASTGGNLTDWVTSTPYVLNDLVKIESRVYRCITAHTSGTFNTDRANWEVIVPLAEMRGWLAASYYYEKDIIVEPFVGRVIMANVSHTANGGSFEPDRAKWDVIVPLQVGTPWAASTYYYNGDIVEYAPDGIFLKRNLSGTSLATYNNVERAEWTLVSSNLVDPFTGGVLYQTGQLASFANKTLRQVVGQVSNATFDVLESGKWAVLESRTEQWTPNTFYYANEQVTNNGLTYSRASAGLSGATFNTTEEASWLRVGDYNSNPKIITSATYTVLPNDGILSFDATANNIVVTFPITLPEGKFFTIHYKKTSNSVTFTAGAGATIVSPLTYTEQASFDAQGSVGQIGTTKIFRLGSVFNFLG
jgi:hypothetical protein